MLLHYLAVTGREDLPHGAYLYTSLEPCHMCSGFITTVGTDITVVSGQPDEGACDRSALRRGVHGCRLIGHNMPDPIALENMRGGQAMIPFLFGLQARGHFMGMADSPSLNVLTNQPGAGFFQEGFEYPDFSFASVD